MARLSEEEIRRALEGLPGWRYDDGELHKRFTFASFAGAIAFINRVAERAEAMDHHPDIENSYTRVRIGMSTWSEAAVTEKDVRLAREVEAVSVDEG